MNFYITCLTGYKMSGNNPYFSDVNSNPNIVDPDEHCKLWFDWNGFVHRDGNLPAAVWPNGDRAFWNHGKFIKYQDGGSEPLKIWMKKYGHTLPTPHPLPDPRDPPQRNGFYFSKVPPPLSPEKQKEIMEKYK